MNDDIHLDLPDVTSNKLCAYVRVKYMYRDADNYKTGESCVMRGPVAVKTILDALENLDEGLYFIPGQIGLADLQGRLTAYDGWGEADHIYHEIVEVVAMDSHDESTQPVMAQPAKAFFEQMASIRWDTAYVPAAMSLAGQGGD